MDVLMVVDSCCAAVGGRGNVIISGRIEFTETGISNTRVDGQTFTQAWRKNLLQAGRILQLMTL
jgi:hypothetical protein